MDVCSATFSFIIMPFEVNILTFMLPFDIFMIFDKTKIETLHEFNHHLDQD